MISPSHFFETCSRLGIHFFSGTPCSFLKPLFDYALQNTIKGFVSSHNEGDAIALATGASLGRHPSVVMFQNSGLGNAVNSLSSLCFPFEIPVLLLVSHRAITGGPKDEPQHELMGRITVPLLESLNVRVQPLNATNTDITSELEQALLYMKETRRSCALTVARGTFEDISAPAFTPRLNDAARSPAFRLASKLPNCPQLKRAEVLAEVQKTRSPTDVVVTTTGYTSREMWRDHDHPGNFYMVGSMGCASAIGLGIAMANSPRRVWVIDGDGALTMRLGNLALVGTHPNAKLVHVVCDNEIHESTGGQRGLLNGMALAQVASACGYQRVFAVNTLSQLRIAMQSSVQGSGTSFVHVKTVPSPEIEFPRPTLSPHHNWKRLECFVRST